MSGNKELAAENEQLRLDLDARFEHSDHQSAKYYRRMRVAERAAEINAAQRDVALKALGESRARFGDMEQRALAAEAVIQKVRELHDLMPGSEYRLSLGMVLAVAGPTVLADHDKEVAARALEAFADSLGVDVSDEDSHELRGYRNGQRQALRKATDRAAAIRSGSEGEAR